MAIDLGQCVSILESGDWISLSFVSADVLRGVGGKVITLPRCRIARNRQPKNVKQSSLSHKISDNSISRDPNHRYHFTRNFELPNKRIVKVHPPLIFKINNEQIL